METRSTLDSTWSVWDSTQFPIIINEDGEVEQRRMGDSNFLILINIKALSRAKTQELQEIRLIEATSKSLLNPRSTQRAAHRPTHGKRSYTQIVDYSESCLLTRTLGRSKENFKAITCFSQSVELSTSTTSKQVRNV
jgi:hypothetical protein